MEGHLVASSVATVLRGLHICPDATESEAQQWLNDMEEQIDTFAEQRRLADEDEDEDEPTELKPPLKFFHSVAQLLWWTLCCATSFDFSEAEPKDIAAQTAVPGQSNFDDYLCLVAREHYNDDSFCQALVSVLYAALADCDNNLIGSDDDTEVIEATRQNISALFVEAIDKKWPKQQRPHDLETQLELGCNLYAIMVATVDSKQDDFSLRRWRECYLAKSREVLTWLLENGDNAIHTQYWILVVYTKRADLFMQRRGKLQSQLYEKMLKDKKSFDMENDHSNIESEFKCPKCGSFKTRQFLMQTRSADEPMTQFWRCWNCNKSGREN
jgi:DNA-directed RNA polymerase subunit M/transcription elongation factor TFIIS